MTCVIVGLFCLVFYGISSEKEEETTDMAPAVEDEYVRRDGSSPNPLVWFLVRIGKRTIPQKLVFELFADVVPRSAENFRALCTGFKGEGGKKLTYKGSQFHQVVPGCMVKGGDITLGNGMGGYSIYGPTFYNENFQLSHTRKYLLSLTNIGGPDTTSSQFFILTNPAPWLDGKHVVIGKVISGQEIIDAIEAEGSTDGKVSQTVTIVDSGEIKNVTEPVTPLNLIRGYWKNVTGSIRSNSSKSDGNAKVNGNNGRSNGKANGDSESESNINGNTKGKHSHMHKLFNAARGIYAR
eukprot:CAMPEP_0167748468 /NCGR_PEP_ID=MMETSP0110_2-20121227/4854_1 /TAXON_ID=629695 /ORGANISM="Gymnochlora sp., Strain CCMP2014" /LENGTH=294 /DNA_ID=CAMNT_0007633485 /DNA_START=81 /DNA_END=965 /DNA_ORIENTATION=-